MRNAVAGNVGFAEVDGPFEREEGEEKGRDFAFETILHGIFVILCLAALLSRGWPGGLACV